MLAYIPYPSWIRPDIIPGLPIRWYGLMYLVAFAITYLLFTWQLKERKLRAGRRTSSWTCSSGRSSGFSSGPACSPSRSMTNKGFYLSHPLQIILPFSFQGGFHMTGIAGMSYHGGLLGTVVALAIFMRVKKLNILDWGDMLVAGIPLGYTFGRLGNFINGELWGRITNVPWGMVFPNAETFPGNLPWVRDFAAAVGMQVSGNGPVNLPRHPSQLYEAFFEGLVLWLILWFIVRKRKPYNGFVIAWYMIGYGVFRFFIEYAREPDLWMGFPIQLAPLAGPAHPVQLVQLHHRPDPQRRSHRGGGDCDGCFPRPGARGETPQENAPRPSPRKLRKKLK